MCLRWRQWGVPTEAADVICYKKGGEGVFGEVVDEVLLERSDNRKVNTTQHGKVIEVEWENTK
jgi:hypothetical protein